MSHQHSKIMERLIAGIALGVAFLVMASVFVPADSDAEPTPLRGVQVRQSLGHETTKYDNALPLGSLESDCYTIEIHSGAIEPLYTVLDNTDGRVLGFMLTADEVMWYFPDMRLNVMDFSAPSESLLYVEPNQH